MKKSILKKIEEFDFKALDKDEILDIAKESKDLEKFEESVRDSSVLDIECIYYCNAMEYLTNNDDSLMESLGIAAEMGLKLEDLNSEILASILMSQEAEKEFSSLIGKLN